MYEEVVAKGGFQATTRSKQWAAIASRECLNLDIMPYVLASYYERYLLPFEEKQLFGRDVPTVAAPGIKRRTTDMNGGPSNEHIATTGELQEAQNVRGTQLPNPSKRLKVQRQEQADLGTLHGLVLALDSQIDREVVKAINLLNVLSYGNHHDLVGGRGIHQAMDSDNEILVDNVPGLLDALYRQLQQCQLLHTTAGETGTLTQTRRRLLNVDEEVGKRELLDTKALLVLNIVRNLSMVTENEKPIADHEDLVLFCILALREIHRNFEIGDHVLDILCNIGKRIDFIALHPPSKIELWHPDYHLAAHLWKRERVLPLECLLQQLTAMLIKHDQRRSIVIRVCELLCSATRDVSLRALLAKSPSLQAREFLDRLVGLLACSRQDFLIHTVSTRRRHVGGSSNGLHDGDYSMDDDEEEDGDDEPEDENTKWPAPWESDGLPSSVGMGIVYVTPEGNRAQAAGTDDDVKVDHEMRDAALEVLYRLSDGDDGAKLRLARHPYFPSRVAGTLTSCLGRPEAVRMAVGVLSNISMNRDTFPYFLPVEKDLILLACSDRSVADLLTNVIADVYGMHAL